MAMQEKLLTYCDSTFVFSVRLYYTALQDAELLGNEIRVYGKWRRKKTQLFSISAQRPDKYYTLDDIRELFLDWIWSPQFEAITEVMGVEESIAREPFEKALRVKPVERQEEKNKKNYVSGTCGTKDRMRVLRPRNTKKM